MSCSSVIANEYEDGSASPADSFSVGSATYEMVNETAQYLLKSTKHRPKIAIICGTGLGIMTDHLTDVNTFSYDSLPNFPISTTKGHRGKLLFGLINKIPVMVMQGRFHVYEGYPLWKCGVPIRVMKLMGIQYLISTNAAGGLNPDYKVGDIMFLRDHINMQGFAADSPLRGKNDERFGPRFPPMNNAYDKHFREAAHQFGKQLNIDHLIKEGIYVMCGGPMFETVAELKFLRKFGVDAVGMSTVPEVLVARHCDLKVFAFSIITNTCIVDYDTDEDTAFDVEEVVKSRSRELTLLLNKMVEFISTQ